VQEPCATKILQQRKFPRFIVELPCLYSIENGPEWNGTAVNLSSGGCAIIGTRPVQRGTYVRIQIFPSPSAPSIVIGLAPVRWERNDQFGVEFITVSPRDQQRLQGYLTFLEAD
jgi:c-di-GMP-binding flagellar brake protein YcgR